MSFEEKIMLKVEYPSIFSPQMEAIVFVKKRRLFETFSYKKLRKNLS